MKTSSKIWIAAAIVVGTVAVWPFPQSSTVTLKSSATSFSSLSGDVDSVKTQRLFAGMTCDHTDHELYYSAIDGLLPAKDRVYFYKLDCNNIIGFVAEYAVD